MTALDCLARLKIDPQQATFEVRRSSAAVGGTTASLEPGQRLTLLELLFGMMLPSGNDAAVALSEAVGLLFFLQGRHKEVCTSLDWDTPFRHRSFVALFVALMNDRVQRLGTLATRIVNCHGNDAFEKAKNVSTCNEVAKISAEFMTYPLLRSIVRTPARGGWENTNKLLEDGFEGIKTGVTETAGPCLSAAYRDFIVVVLHSKSPSDRWIEVKKLIKWIIARTA